MIHYLILAHKGPKQLQKLIEVLSGEKSRVYLHLDAKSRDISLLNLKKVEYIDSRVSIQWGGFTMIEATLQGLFQIYKNMNPGDHVVILSGQDFPIQPPNEIRSFLEKHQTQSFMEYRIQPNDEWNILNRVTKYYFHDLLIPEWIDTLIKRIIKPFYPVHILRNQAFGYILSHIFNFFPPERTYLIRNYKIFWGSQWQVLSEKHVGYMRTFLTSPEGKKYKKEFSRVAGPDELFFQTLLLNSPYKDEVENNLLWYIDWHTGPGLPRIFDSSDFDAMSSSGKLFARKFDEGISDEIIDRIIKNF